MHNTRRFFPLAAALCTLLLAPLAAQAAQYTVTITDNQFAPQSITVNPGDKITWINQGSATHRVLADNNSFDSGQIPPGQQFAITFNQASTYAYHDPNFGYAGSGMTGTIAVSSAIAVGAPTPVYQPQPATSATLTQLYAQVQALLAQVNTLQGQGASAAAPSSSGSCPQFARSLSLGATGADVTQLQQFLARDPSIYPEGIVSGYFGSLTQAAVQRWQTKYNIVSSGTPATTGFGVVGPHTAAAMSQLCSTGGGNAGNGGTAGGFIQVSPVSGNAPLTVNISATVNTAASCGGSTYTLDFGDGTPAQTITVGTGSCSQQVQTFTHTYSSTGTFQIVLSSGGHSTSATVTVTGTAQGTVQGTITAFTTAGNAPLTVNFYVSCASGVAYNVVFGDGSDLGGSGVSGTTCGTGGLATVTHTYTKAGNYNAQLVIFSQQSTGLLTPVPVGSVSINVAGTAATSVQAQGSISAFTTTGNAPLTVNFYVSCAVGSAYDVVFGDGSDLGGTNVSGTNATCNSGGLANASHTYTNPGNYSAQLVIFSRNSSGIVTPSTVGSVAITVGSVATNYVYSAPTLTYNSVYFVSLQIDLPTSCTGYDISWGDGTADTVQHDGGGSCAQTSTTQTLKHTYSAFGSYPVDVLRGAAQVTVGTVVPKNYYCITSINPVVVEPVTAGTPFPSNCYNTSNYMQSDTLTALITYSYNTPNLTSGTSALSTGLQFDLPTPCTGYSINWGDGTTPTSQTDGGISCAQTAAASVTKTHAYAQAGSFTITLTRGTATPPRTDTVAVTVSN